MLNVRNLEDRLKREPVRDPAAPSQGISMERSLVPSVARHGGSPRDAKEWYRRSRRYLRVAAHILEAGFADVCAFYCQQASEFALKALQVHLHGRFDRTHDLTRLAKDVSAPPRIVKIAAAISPTYVAARYPDVGGSRITRRNAESYLDDAGRLVRWVRRQMV